MNPTTTYDRKLCIQKVPFHIQRVSFQLLGIAIDSPHTVFAYLYHNSVEKVETVNIKPGYLVETIPSA